MRPRKFTSTRRLGVKMLSLDGKREIPWRACYSQAFCHVAPTFRGYKLKLLRKNRMIRKMFVPRTNQNQTSIQKSKCLSSFGPSWYPSTPHPQRRIPRFNVWLYLSTMKRLENSTKVFRWRWFAVFFHDSFCRVAVNFGCYSNFVIQDVCWGFVSSLSSINDSDIFCQIQDHVKTRISLPSRL